MNKKLLRKKLALMLATLKKKRKYYVELEYLESTGTQYIDTGYKMSAGKTMTFNGNIMWTQSNGIANFFYGYRSVNSAEYRGDMRAFFVYGQSGGGSAGRLAIRYGVNTDNSTSIISQNQKYNISFDGTNLKVDGTTFIYLSEAYTPANYQNMWLFNCNTTGYYSADVAKFSGRIYNWQIFEDGVLVRDFIPVLDWNMTPCMYDRVTEQLFYNQGTGDFVAGREIHPVEYLESTGTQYIDTGIKPTTNTYAELEVLFTELDSTYRTPLSIRTSDGAADSFTIAATTSSANTYAFGYRTYWNTNAPTLNTKYFASLKAGVAVFGTQTGNAGASITSSNLTAYLFARNANGTAGNFLIGRIYYCQIKSNGVLVRDFIPAISEDGTPFMFDRVTHTCFLNAGTGAFKYPARELEYIKNNGSNTYLSLTGFYPTPDWDIECEVMGKTWGFTSGFNSLNIMGCGSSASTDSYTLTIAQGDVGATTPTCRRGGAGVRKVGCDLNVKYKIISTETSITWNGEAGTFLSQPTGNTATTNPITLFRNPLSTAIGTMNIYSFVVKSHQTGNKILDLVPVLMNGSAGMLDKVNNVMYTNQGTGSWTLGKIVEPEYE